MKKMDLLKKILLVFLYFIPLLQVRWFYNSYTTLFMVVFVYLCLFAYLIIDRVHFKKNSFIFIPLLIVLLSFFVLHNYNALNFNSLVPGNFNYSVIEEILYFVKMTVPLVLIFLLYKMKYNRKNYLNLLSTWLLFFSLVIIVTNFLGLSYGSYSGEVIKGNFFTWFGDGYAKYTFFHLGSIGYFESANQISGIYLLCLPFLVMGFLEKFELKKLFVIFCSCFAMFLIGTKTAVFGIFIVLIVSLIIAIFMRVITKQKFSGKSCIIILAITLIFALLYPYSIVENRKIVQDLIDNEVVEEVPILPVETDSSIGEEMSYSEKIEYIEKNYKSKRILETLILERYPYQYDADFWYDILKLDTASRTDYRFLEQALARRVVEINNNSYDKFFGIGYSRMQNLFNIEKDFVMQYYSVGILGVILFLGGYFVFLVKDGIGVLRAKFKGKIYAVVAGFSICLFMLVAYQSGNLFNSLFVMIPFAVLFGVFHNESENLEKIKE